MTPTIKSIGIANGGGDCPGLNAVIRGAVRAAIMGHGWRVVGIHDGFDGLIWPERTVPLTIESIAGILPRGGTILGTTNRGNPFHYVVEEDGKKVTHDYSMTCCRNMEKLGLDAMIAIGGDGTLTIARDLGRMGIPMIGVPKTIDNDLYAGAGTLLALGIWRAPLLILAYLYQTTLIALNRESVGVRTLVAGAIGIVPLVALLRLSLGLPGASLGVLLIGLGLVLTGYGCLAREGRQPAWHHHLARPVLASLTMIPVCLALKHFHVLLAVAGGAITYVAFWVALGGLRHTQLWRRVLGPLAGSGSSS